MEILQYIICSLQSSNRGEYFMCYVFRQKNKFLWKAIPFLKIKVKTIYLAKNVSWKVFTILFIMKLYFSCKLKG